MEDEGSEGGRGATRAFCWAMRTFHTLTTGEEAILEAEVEDGSPAGAVKSPLGSADLEEGAGTAEATDDSCLGVSSALGAGGVDGTGFRAGGGAADG